VACELKGKSGTTLSAYEVKREIHFCYGHRLLNYAGKCRWLHGHNGRAVVVLEAKELDARGMVLDFSEIKRRVAAWIDENLDHRMILHRDDPLLETLRAAGEPVFVLEVNPTAENLAKLIFEHVQDAGLPVVEVQLWETPASCATYRPPPRDA
jgi:6-pyruvoyltetrahydropterin/6-carboxytetrahydropterin synthase